MALDLNSIASLFDEQDCVTEVSDKKGIQDAIDIQQKIWGGDHSDQLTHLLSSKSSAPVEVSIYVVYADGKPVTSAWIVYNEGSPFAGI